MSDFIRQQLQYIITQYGRAICDDHRRCEALLRDLCPENKREVNVLVIALKSKVAEDLMKITDAMPKEIMLSRLFKRLEDDYGLAEKISRWAVETWASVLRGVSAAEMNTRHAAIPEVRKDKPIQVRENKNPDKAKYQIRSKPILTDDPVSAFKLNKKQKPLEYVENDFKDNRDGTITDRATGLIWQKSGSQDRMNYDNAKAYVANLNRDGFAGHRDWRLPTVDELTSLLTPEKKNRDLYIDPIFDKTQLWCWTSDQRTSGGAWVVYFFGAIGWGGSDFDYVRAVCASQVRENKKPDKAKYQIRSKPISTDDFKLDGESRPLKYINNDYVDNGDGTITDRATGLIWQKSGSQDYISYENVKDYIAKLNRDRFAGHRDWRLPTVDELKSLLTQVKQSNDLYIAPIFNNTQRWCWTSDQHAYGGEWYINFHLGYVYWTRYDNLYVRAVRSAQ